ncbi:hypothetical protein DET49_113131 [Salegentibacter sp. 24]|nr:hypothetical protein DET49_113131 [Salegentibacter sp. 24]
MYPNGIGAKLTSHIQFLWGLPQGNLFFMVSCMLFWYLI